MDLMPKLMFEHNLIVDSLQLVDGATFQITHRLGQKRFGNEVLGFGQSYILYIATSELFPIQVKMIANVEWLLLLLLLLGVGAGLVNKLLVA